MSFILQPLRKIPNLEISPLRITSLINTLEERSWCFTLDHKKKRTPKHVNGGNTRKGQTQPVQPLWRGKSVISKSTS